MVQEIVHIQIGFCGNQIGNRFWTTLGKEHKLSLTGQFTQKSPQNQLLLDKISVYYNEAGTMKFVPRACFIDLDATFLDRISSSPLSALYKQDNIGCGGYGSCGGYGAWAKGMFTTGQELIDETMDIIRKEVELCDSPQGIQITHSVGGGTGGGMGSLILLKLRDDYGGKCLSTFSVFPSSKVSTDNKFETYSAILTLHQLIQNSDITHVIDNEALFNIAHNVFKQSQPHYAHYNWVIAMAMSGITAPLRFNCNLNGTLRKMGINLIGYPRLHFLLSSQAPMLYGSTNKKKKIAIEDLNQIWLSNNYLANVDASDGKYLLTSCCYRGNGTSMKYLTPSISEYCPRYIDPNIVINSILRNIVTYQHIPSSIINLCNKYIPFDACIMNEKYEKHLYLFEQELNKMKQKISINDQFVSWIPNSVKSSLIEIPLYSGFEDIESSCTMISNSTSIKHVFNRINNEFAKMYKTKVGLNLYTDNGMDLLEFQEAHANVRDLITEIQDKQDAVVDGISDYDDEYDETESDEDYDESDEYDDEEEEEDDF